MITYEYKMDGRTENAKVKKESGVCVDEKHEEGIKRNEMK